MTETGSLAASAAQLFAAAAGSPLVQAGTIRLSTFVLEVAATVFAALRVQEGGVALPVALVALYVGVALGDVGLYGLGRLSATVPLAQRLVAPETIPTGRAWLRGRLFKVVLASRFLPGTRLPIYTACGFLHADLREFALSAVAATLLWTTLLFSVSLCIGQFLIDHFGVWRWAGAGGLAITLMAAGHLVGRDAGKRR